MVFGKLAALGAIPISAVREHGDGTRIWVGGLDALALAAGLPGGRVLGPALLTLLVFGLLCGIRGAARWRPDQSWRATLGSAPRMVLGDWIGSALVLGALAVLGLVVAGSPAFWLVAPGLLTLAAVAVQRRRIR
jgi:hypothetical protein